VANDLKHAVPHLDLRELKGEVSRTRKSKRAGDAGAHSELMVGNRQLRDMGDEAIRLLERSNVPPTLFVRSGSLCQVVEDERGRPLIRVVTGDIMLARLAKICDFVTQTEEGPKNVVPPKHIASYVLSESSWPFPAIEGITRSPTLRQDGTISQLPGYDPATRLYYHTVGDERLPSVPDKPTSEDTNAARALIDELLHDFPFDCPASKANAIALLLSPLLLPAIGDVTPLFLVDAPTAGSGKSLLATVTAIISAGAMPDFTTAPTKDEEWPKKITAILSGGPSLVVIDNVKYTIQSADLAMLLTTKSWKERVFGKNTETIVLPNRAVWVATGNNIQLGGDIPRRCVWIRIDPKSAKPHERDGFLHPNLTEWVLGNRGRLLSALLTLCRAWYAAGRPAYPIPAFGSFERWAETVGSILTYVGIVGFLENRDTLWEQSDMKSTEWEGFLASWLESYGSTPVTPKELLRAIEAGEGIAEAVPVSVSDAVHGKGDGCSRIGYQFRARFGKRYGPRGIRLAEFLAGQAIGPATCPRDVGAPRLADIDAKIGNIRRSIEDGMPDTAWAYSRMEELLQEKQRLGEAPAMSGQPPKIDASTALAYRRQTEKILSAGTNTERKQLLRSCVDHIKLAPESLEVEITYKIPEHLVNIVGAGTLSIAIYNAFAAWLVWGWTLSRNGRRCIT
jgi:hypothetical protein